MKSILAVLCLSLALHQVAFSQQQPAASKPVVVASEEDEGDASERLLARLEKAAQRYLDLANASTDQKATADFLRLYEEKEKAIVELRKQTEAERKSLETLRAVKGWSKVATEAASRAQQAYNDAVYAASNEDPKAVARYVQGVKEEAANGTRAREEAVALISTGALGMVHKPLAALELNRLEEQRRIVADALEQITKLMK